MRIRDYVTGRVLSYIAIAIIGAALSLCGIGKAHATAPYPCQDSSIGAQLCSQSAARTACESMGGDMRSEIPATTTCVQPEAGRYQCRYSFNGEQGNCSDAGATKPNGGPLFYFKADAQCDSRPPLKNISFQSASNVGAVCSNGCAYSVNISERFTIQGTGANKRFYAETMSPNGETCDSGDTETVPYKPDKNVCVSLAGGTYSECVKPNGDHCITSGGKQLCWKFSDGPGKRMTTDGTLSADREKPPTQPSPPTNQEQPEKKADTTTTINGDTYNTSIYSGTGNKGGQSDVGEGGKDSGGPDGDGKGGEDGDDKGTASGGQTCDLAPSCSGDEIMCAQLQQIYSDRCDEAARHNAEAAAANALSKDKGTDDFDLSKIFASDDEEYPEGPDESGYGWGRTCPDPPEFFSTTLDQGAMCNMFQAIGVLVLTFGALHAYYILTGK